MLAVLVAVTLLVNAQTDDVLLIAYWYLGAGVIAMCLVAFVIGRRHTKNPPAAGSVLCIVPAYNEDPEGLHKTVTALLRQTVPVDIVVIDDGSQVPVVPSVIDPRVMWRRQANTGKRGAQVAVLKEFGPTDYDFVLTVDSDSEPYPDACEQLLRARLAVLALGSSGPCDRQLAESTTFRLDATATAHQVAFPGRIGSTDRSHHIPPLSQQQFIEKIV